MYFLRRLIVLLIAVTILWNAVSCEELLELSCIDAHDCTQFEKQGVNVTCDNGQCRCNSTTGNMKCSPINVKQSNIIGGHCPCQLPHSECNKEEDICYCKKEYMASTDKRRCVRETVGLEEICELHAQCYAADHHSICDSKSKKCSCRPNFISHNKTCISVADPNTVCENDQDCQKHGAHVNCLVETQKCTCINGYIKALNKSECLPIVSYHENCTDHQQCQTNLGPNGSCINGTCECNNKHYWMQKQVKTESKKNVTHSRCFRIIPIGEYCREDKDCYYHEFPDEEETMSCMFSECSCKWGYNSINGMECFKSSDGTYFKPMLQLVILPIFAILSALI